MAIDVCDLNLVLRQVLEKLQASPQSNRYPTTPAVGTNSDFPVLQELKDNILIIDQAVCLDIMSADGHWYAPKFMALSATEYDSGELVAEHIGRYGDIQVSIGSTFKPGLVGKSRDEILLMNDFPDMYAPSRYFVIENNFAFHNGAKLKGHFHVFNKTALCQSPGVYEDVLIYGAISLAEKLDASDPFFRKNDSFYQATRGMVKAGAEFIPAEQQLEQQMKQAA